MPAATRSHAMMGPALLNSMNGAYVKFIVLSDRNSGHVVNPDARKGFFWPGTFRRSSSQTNLLLEYLGTELQYVSHDCPAIAVYHLVFTSTGPSGTSVGCTKLSVHFGSLTLRSKFESTGQTDAGSSPPPRAMQQQSRSELGSALEHVGFVADDGDRNLHSPSTDKGVAAANNGFGGAPAAVPGAALSTTTLSSQPIRCVPLI